LIPLAFTTRAHTRALSNLQVAWAPARLTYQDRPYGYSTRGEAKANETDLTAPHLVHCVDRVPCTVLTGYLTRYGESALRGYVGKKKSRRKRGRQHHDNEAHAWGVFLILVGSPHVHTSPCGGPYGHGTTVRAARQAHSAWPPLTKSIERLLCRYLRSLPHIFEAHHPDLVAR